MDATIALHNISVGADDKVITRNDGITSVNVTPIATIAHGEKSFVINITVNPAEPIAGVQFNLSFDANFLVVNSVAEGDLFHGYDTFFNPGTIDNINGTIKAVYNLITAQGGSVDSMGTIACINFTAKSGDGVSSLNLSNVIVGDPNSSSIPLLIYNGSITVFTLPDFINATCSLPVIPEDTDGNPMLCPDNPNCSEVTNITVTITSTSSIASVTINLSPLGWSPTVPLIRITGTDTWYILVNATAGTAVHNGTGYVPYALMINVTDEYGNWNTTTVNITVWRNGDMNGDGVITLYDATYLAKWYFNQQGFEYLPVNVADVSGDCIVTLYDATYLAKWYFNQPGFEELH